MTKNHNLTVRVTEEQRKYIVKKFGTFSEYVRDMIEKDMKTEVEV